jgi:hypothetical protein
LKCRITERQCPLGNVPLGRRRRCNGQGLRLQFSRSQGVIPKRGSGPALLLTRARTDTNRRRTSSPRHSSLTHIEQHHHSAGAIRRHQIRQTGSRRLAMQALHQHLPEPRPGAHHNVRRQKCAIPHAQRHPNTPVSRQQQVRYAIPVYVCDLGRERIRTRISDTLGLSSNCPFPFPT